MYSQATLERHISTIDGAFEGIPHLTCYSMKANANAAILRLLAASGLGADIVSGGELYRALRAGIPADRIVYSGVGKTSSEIEYALQSGILMFNVEFFVAKVAEIKPAGISPLKDVRGKVENAVRQQMGVKKAEEVAQRILGRMQAGKTLQAAVAEDEFKNAMVRTEEVTKAGNVQGVGVRSALVLKAFQLETVGGNTGVVKSDTGAGIAVLLEKIPVNETQFQNVREQLRQKMQGELMNEVVSQYLENLRKTAKINPPRLKTQPHARFCCHRYWFLRYSKYHL